LTLYARNSIHSLIAAFHVADFDVDIEKGRIENMATKKAAKKSAKKAVKKSAKKK
jgi:hypothetical protein